MRLLLVNMLATTLLLIGASSAGAVIITATANWDGTNILSVSDTITIVVRLDTELQQDLQLVDVGVQFDPTVFEYDAAASSMSSYLIYAPGVAVRPPIPATWLTPLPHYVDGGAVDFAGGLQSSPTLFPVYPFDQVNLGYQETSLRGTRDITANTLGQLYGDVMGTLVFRIVAVADSTIAFNLVINSQNRVQLQDGTILDQSVVLIFTPEPSTALLLGFGLVGLRAAGRRGI